MSYDGQAPCDIYSSTGTPCVAAHSVVRSLFQAYDGPLYRIRRADKATLDVGVLIAGGIANATAQDAFCGPSQCTIIRIFDQSPFGNHLDVAPGGPWYAHHADVGVNASKAPLKLNGRTVYGAYFEGGHGFWKTGMGYRNDNTSGVATGDEPETIYMVVDGKHHNNKCCFDYGNAETDAHDDGKGTMEAVYFGNAKAWGHGAGDGPWVMADLEDGLWSSDEKVSTSVPSIDAQFVTAMIKGQPGGFAIKAGDVQGGLLNKVYEGARPKGYARMSKQGGIILGIGGDNSDWAVGTFYEGVMTKGYSTDAADDAVQANIVAMGYQQWS